MQYICNYDTFINEGLFNKNKNLYKNIHNDLSTQFYFLTTFNASILGIYPIVEKLLFNSKLDLNLSHYQIALLTIFTIAEFIHHYQGNDDLKNKLIEEGIYEHVDIFKKILHSLKILFTKVAKSFGKTINKFIDMIGFVALIVPFNNILLNITSENNLDASTLWKITGIGVAMSIGTFSLKHLITDIMSYLKNFFRKNENFEWDFDDEEFEGIINIINNKI